MANVTKLRAEGRSNENLDPRTAREEAENTDDELEISNEDTAAPYPEHKTTQEVRQGHTGDHVRYILLASFAGAAVVLGLAYLFFFA